MTRYLLFDSGCIVCTDVAQTIERETDGWLIAQSLRASDMQELLTRAHPDWQWEPTLLEVENDQVRAYTGVALRTKLLAGIGPRKTLRVAQLVYQAMTPQREANPSRRKFLKQGATVLGGVLFSLGRGPLGSVSAAGPQTATPGNGPQNPHHPVQQTDLPEGTPLRKAVFASPGIQAMVQRYGVGALSQVSHTKYTHSDTEAVTMLLQRPGAPNRVVFAYFKPGQSAFRVYQFEFSPSSEMQAALDRGTRQPPVSGRAMVLDPNERPVLSAVYSNNKAVTANSAPSGASSTDVIRPAGMDPDCFGNCLAYEKDNLPWYMQILCGGSLTLCITTHLPPPCAAALGCLGGWGLSCANACWV